MDHVSILIVVIEAAVGLAGFAGIVVAFQYRDSRLIRRREVLGLSFLVQNSLLSAVFATIPLLLESFNLPQQTVWKWSSILVIGNYLIMAYIWLRRLKKADVGSKTQRLLYYSLFIPNLLIAGILFMNVFGVVFNQEFGPYLLALAYPLGAAGLIFAQLILRPLWISVLKSEKAAAEAAAANSSSSLAGSIKEVS